MQKKYLMLLMIGMVFQLSGQKYFTKGGVIAFSSNAPLEKIEATNSKATSVFDLETGAIEWAVLIKGFQFEKALMQEHFNENYMESSQFPKAKFTGQLQGIADVDFSKDGKFKLKVSGQLDIHGVSQDIVTEANFNIAAGVISARSVFNVLVADYNIEIPSVVKDNIAKEVEIVIEATYQEFKK